MGANEETLLKYLREHLEKILIALIVLFAIFSIRTLFFDGIPITMDHPIHVMASWHMADNLLPEGKPLGYDPYNFCGWVFAQYPLAYMFISVIHYFGLGFYSIVGAYKIGLTLAYILPILSIYIFMKSFGFGSRIALSATFFQTITFLDEQWGAGIYFQVIYSGFFANSFSIAFLLLAIAVFHQAYVQEKEKWFLFSLGAGVFASASVLTHPHSIVLIILSLGAYLILLPFIKEKILIKRLLLLMLIGAVTLVSLTAFFFLPYFSYLSNYYPYNSIVNFWRWDMKTILYFATHNMKYFPLLVLGIIGFVICMCKTKFSKRFLVLTSILTLFLAFGIDFLVTIFSALPIPGFESFLRNLLVGAPIPYSRYLVFLHVLVSGLAGIGFVYVFGKLERIDKKYFEIKFKIKITKRIMFEFMRGLTSTIFMLSIIIICIFSQVQSTDLGYGITNQEKKILLSNDYPLSMNIYSTMDWMKHNVPMDTRILIEDTFGGLTTRAIKDWYLRGALQDNKTFPTHSHVFELTPVYSRVSVLGVWAATDYVSNNFGVSAHGNIFGTKVDRIDDNWFISTFVPAIKELGIGYVLCYSTELTNILETNEFLFEELYSDGVFHIFQLKPISKIFIVENLSADQDVKLSIIRFEPNFIQLDVSNIPSKAKLHIRLIYYPNWKCYVDGEEQDIQVIEKLGLPFMSINIREGDSQVILKFEETPVSLVGNIISCGMGILILSIFLIHNRDYISTFMHKVIAKKS